MPDKVLLITHKTPTMDDRASAHLETLGYELDWRTPANGEALPVPDEQYAGAIIYGGYQPVDEQARYPYLKDELKLIETWLRSDKPLLGICLGAQLIAHQLGAAVGPHPQGLHEFGYYRIIPTDEGRAIFGDGIHAAQSHYHGFDLPDGTVRLAYSDYYPTQAMRYSRATFAFQFHPEATKSVFRRWQREVGSHAGQPGVHIRARQDADMERYDAPQHAWFVGFLEAWIAGSVAEAATGAPPLTVGNPVAATKA